MASVNLEYSLLPKISIKDPFEDLDIIKIIGSGTYGEVYRAEVKTTKEFVALKSIKIEVGDDFNSVQQEVSILAECRHENIVGYYGSCFKDGKLWISLEYCGGGSLPEIYKNHGPLPEDAIAFVSREALKGLEYLHSKNMMHRDIKGANLLLTSDGDVKLSDFSLSTALLVTLKRKTFVGTPYWMAPEVLAVEKKGGYNSQCDIWSVGITAIELAETQPPLFDLHPMTALVMMSKRSFKPESLKDKKRWSKEFEMFIKHLLVKDPVKKPTASQALSHSFVYRSTARKESIKPLLKYHTLQKPQQSAITVSEEFVCFEDMDTTDIRYRPLPEIPETDRPALPPKKSRSRLVSVTKENNLDPIDLTIVPLILSSNKQMESENPESSVNETTSESKNECNSSKQQGEAIYERFPKNLVIYGLRTQLTKANSDIQDTAENTTNHSLTRVPSGSDSHAIYGHLGRNINKVSSQVETKPPLLPPLPPRLSVTKIKRALQQAYFSKIFHSCPLHINSATTWVHPDSKDKYVLIGSTEGLYSLLLANRLDAEMEQMYPRKIWWLTIFRNVMLSITSEDRYMCMTLLLNMYDRSLKDTPQQYVHTTKVKGSRGTIHCAVIHNPYTREHYYCGITASSVIILQWFEPKEIFMLKVLIDFTFPYEVNLCEGIFYSYSEKMPLPVLITGVRDAGNSNVTFDVFDPNANQNYFSSLNQFPLINSKGICQIEPNTVLVVHDRVVKFVNLHGKLKPNFPGNYKSKVNFNFKLEGYVRLCDYILIFHKHGMQVKSLVDGEVTAEVFEETKLIKLLGSEINIIIESRNSSDLDGPSNLYIFSF